MEKLSITDWLALVAAIGVIVSMLTNIAALRDKRKTEVESVTEMRSDIKHIREKVDKFDDIPERMVAVEASAKQAHHRIDRLESKERAK